MAEYISTDHYLDLRGIVCPVNFVKCSLTLEKLSSNDILKVDVDLGEAETSLIQGLQEKGYIVNRLHEDSKRITLIISSE